MDKLLFRCICTETRTACIILQDTLGCRKVLDRYIPIRIHRQRPAVVVIDRFGCRLIQVVAGCPSQIAAVVEVQSVPVPTFRYGNVVLFVAFPGNGIVVIDRNISGRSDILLRNARQDLTVVFIHHEIITRPVIRGGSDLLIVGRHPFQPLNGTEVLDGTCLEG